jgi:flagellar biogenesis protein FliO
MLDAKISRQENSRVLRRSSKGETPAVLAARSGAPKRSWLRTIGALAGVVGLIVLLAWGYRAAASGGLSWANRSRRPGLIEVLSKTMLSPRQSLCLVRVGSRVVLVGQTQDRLCALDVIEDAGLAASLAGQALAGKPDSSSTEFQKALESEAGGYRNEDDVPAARPTRKIKPVDHVRREVLDAIERIRRTTARAR